MRQSKQSSAQPRPSFVRGRGSWPPDGCRAQRACMIQSGGHHARERREQRRRRLVRLEGVVCALRELREQPVVRCTQTPQRGEGRSGAEIVVPDYAAVEPRCNLVQIGEDYGSEHLEDSARFGQGCDGFSHAGYAHPAFLYILDLPSVFFMLMRCGDVCRPLRRGCLGQSGHVGLQEGLSLAVESSACFIWVIVSGMFLRVLHGLPSIGPAMHAMGCWCVHIKTSLQATSVCMADGPTGVAARSHNHVD